MDPQRGNVKGSYLQRNQSLHLPASPFHGVASRFLYTIIRRKGVFGLDLGEVPAFGHNAQGGAERGTTPGWFDGKDVTFFYNKDFFCQ
ncbi:hypothetical protein BH23GEM5_BH23GEM5_24260 [soil metagenome]|jgi:hypothetical protein